MDQRILMATVAVLIVFVIAAIVIGIINISKINSILDYSDDGDLVENLEKYYNNVRDLQKKIKMSHEGMMSERISACEKKINLGLSKIGIVNFDAFDDVSCKQSFSIAVLDQHNSGFILTSLYGNNSSNMYLREIKNGKSKISLLEEEKEAIKKAIEKNINQTENL